MEDREIKPRFAKCRTASRHFGGIKESPKDYVQTLFLKCFRLEENFCIVCTFESILFLTL